MVVFIGIAVLCLGALIARYLREKKCQSGECPQPDPGEPDPDTLMVTVSYYPPPGAPPSQASQISEDVIQELHNAFVKSQDVQKWRVQLTVLDAICYSGYLREDWTGEPVSLCPSIIVTLQSMSESGNCFPCCHFDYILTTINKNFTDSLRLKDPIKTFVLKEPLKSTTSESQRPQPWQPKSATAT